MCTTGCDHTIAAKIYTLESQKHDLFQVYNRKYVHKDGGGVGNNTDNNSSSCSCFDNSCTENNMFESILRKSVQAANNLYELVVLKQSFRK